MPEIAEALPASTRVRTLQLFEEHRRNCFLRTDRIFIWLLPIQWLGGVAVALWISPKAWAGASSYMHPHVWAALVLGGAISLWPVICAIRNPGETLTRHTIAVGQMLMSALLIHLTGGRIETHFHVFGSLAFLAFYRDWKVILSASIVVAVDHFVRGVYFPLSVFGVLTASHFRWIEHAWWVVFEDIFLFIAIRQSLKEMLDIAVRQATLEAVNAGIERKIAERTVELTKEIAERKDAEAKLEVAHKDLLETSRRAGMAEVATSVLHNVGNVLNSVNISCSVISDAVAGSRVGGVMKAAELLRLHEKDLASFLTTDPAGQKLPEYLGKLGGRLTEDQGAMLKEIRLLSKNVEHIKEVIAVQQDHAHADGIRETLSVKDMVEDALSMNAMSMTRHHVEIIREYEEVPPVHLEKHKVLQILVNLINNAKHALSASEREHKQMTIRIGGNNGHIDISIKDNGIGIPTENLTRIFAHGFTTKKGGHGFGLHSGVLSAREIGGQLKAYSEGPGKGAIFTLELPVVSPPGQSPAAAGK